MNAVREWTAIVCMAVLAASLLQHLTTNGSMEKTARLVIGAFVICAFLIPLTKLVPQLSIEMQDVPKEPDTALQSMVENQTSQAVQSSVKNLVTAELSRMGIKSKNVSVQMDTKEDGSIGISKVIVVLAKESGGNCQRASAKLEQLTGLQMEVTADGG